MIMAKTAEKKVLVRDNAFQRFEVLKTNRNKRYRYNEFLVEGVRSLNEAVSNNWNIKSLLYSGDRASLSGWASDMLQNVPTEVNYCLEPELMRELSGKEDTSELMAVIEMREDRLDAVTLSGQPLMYDPDVVTAAMGSFFSVPVVRAEDNRALLAYIGSLKERYPDFTMIGTTAHKEHPVSSVNLAVPLMLMVGNETKGLNRAFKDSCDMLCTIPMAESSHASSLNVSCAASILLYEVVRQRTGSV